MHKRVTLGGLSCRVVGGDAQVRGASPALVVVLCHGYGAPGEDLVPLAFEIMNEDPVLHAMVRFVFPAAPLNLEGMQIGEQGTVGARAWWPLDERRLESTLAGDRALDLRDELPEGLLEAADTMLQMLEDVRRSELAPPERIVLGGFSQGAMLATEVALRLPASPAALCVFSGQLLCRDRWQEMAPARAGMPVLMSHGRQDPLLSFAGAQALRDLLAGAGCAVEFLPFDGPHTIPQQSVFRLIALLRNCLPATG